MLADAIRQYLKAQGLAKVNVGLFTDYAQDTSYAVATSRDTDAEFPEGGAYGARIQLRARSTNAVAAESAARTALNHLLGADGVTLLWDDPTGPATRSYLLEAISRRNGPDYFPTPGLSGHQATANLSLLVTEV